MKIEIICELVLIMSRWKIVCTVLRNVPFFMKEQRHFTSKSIEVFLVDLNVARTAGSYGQLVYLQPI